MKSYLTTCLAQHQNELARYLLSLAGQSPFVYSDIQKRIADEEIAVASFQRSLAMLAMI